MEIGHDNLKFESGPFHYFGQNAIRLSTRQMNRLNEWCDEVNRNPKIFVQRKMSKSTKSVSKNICKRPLNKEIVNIPVDVQKIIQTDSCVSDYSLRVLETSLYVKINRATYIAAHNLSYAQEKFQDNQLINTFENELDRQIELASTPVSL